MDLSNLSPTELHQLSQQIESQLKSQRKQQIAKALEDIEAIAQSVGMSVAELVSHGTSSKVSTKVKKPRQPRAPLPPRFINPADNTQTWTGVGKAPVWVRNHLEAGGSRDELRIVP